MTIGFVDDEPWASYKAPPMTGSVEEIIAMAKSLGGAHSIVKAELVLSVLNSRHNDEANDD